MTAAAETAPSIRQRLMAGQAPFLLSRLHSLTGILFGLFVLFHLLINATLVEGFREGVDKTVYQKQIDYIHSIPFLTLTKWLLIYLPIIYHTLYGLWLTYQAKQNVNQYPYGKNVFYVFQRLSGLVLVTFIVFHVSAMKGWFGTTLKFYPLQATQSVAAHFGASWLIGWFVYPLGILAACFHLSYGFWTAAISWGVTLSAAAQRRWGWVCVFIFAFTFICGMTALAAALGSAALAKH
jgi:succinate dehydrogenase / fumarate reductase, cytochrome b subunit